MSESAGLRRVQEGGKVKPPPAVIPSVRVGPESQSLLVSRSLVPACLQADFSLSWCPL